MHTPSSTLVDLETKFWQSMVDHETDVALKLLCEPALMVSSHGAMKFDHAGYRQMADHGSMVVNSFELSGMHDTSTWVKTDHGWRCAMHTETPVTAH